MAISLVQAATPVVGTSNIAFSNPTAGGNCVVILVGSFSPAIGTASSITAIGVGTDSASPLHPGAKTGDSANGLIGAWADADCTAGQTSISVSTSNVTVANMALFAFEFSGLSKTDASLLDVYKAGTTGTGLTWTSGSGAGSSYNNEVFLGMGITYDSTGSLTITGDTASGWVNETAQYANSNEIGVVAGYKIVTAGGAPTYNGTVSPSSEYLAVALALNPQTMPQTAATSGAGAVSGGGYSVGISSASGSGVTTGAAGPLAQSTLTGAGVASGHGGPAGAGSIAGAGLVTGSASIGGITQGVAVLNAAGVITPEGTIQVTANIGGNGAVLSVVEQYCSAQISSIASVSANDYVAGFSGLYSNGTLTGAGFSTVQKTAARNMSWNARSLTSPVTRSCNWKTRKLVNETCDAAWNLKAHVFTDRIIRYKDLVHVTVIDIPVRWNVVPVSVSTNTTFSWKSLRTLTNARVVGWNLYQALTAEKILSWEDRKTVVISKESNWKLREKVFTTSQSAWKLRKSVTEQPVIKWNTKFGVLDTSEVKWKTRKQDLVTSEFTWNLGITPVNLDPEIFWNTLKTTEVSAVAGWDTVGRIVITSDLMWDTLSAGSTNVAIEWIISPEVQADIRQTSLQDVFFSYPGA